MKDELTELSMKASLQMAQTINEVGIEQLKRMFLRKKRCGRMVEALMKIESLLGLPEGLEVSHVTGSASIAARSGAVSVRRRDLHSTTSIYHIMSKLFFYHLLSSKDDSSDKAHSFHRVGAKDIFWFLNGTEEEDMCQIRGFYYTVWLL